MCSSLGHIKVLCTSSLTEKGAKLRFCCICLKGPCKIRLEKLMPKYVLVRACVDGLTVMDEIL